VADHYRKPPNIKDLTLLFVTENGTRMAMLKTGEADIIYLHGSQLPEARQDPNIRISRSNYCNLEAFTFFDFMNGTKGPWQDIRVRQAVDYAIDRKLICEKVLNGNFKPYRGILAPYNPGFDPSEEVPTKYDPEKAKALLKEAGYAKGITAPLWFLTSRKPQAEAIAGYLQAVGINLKLNMMENAPLVKKIWARDCDGVGLGTGVWWVGRVHPGVALKSFQTNTARYGYSASQEITDLVNKSLTTVNPTELVKIGREINDVYLKQMNQLTLWATSYTIGIGPKMDKAPAISGWPQPSGFEYYTLK
jgi:ABC-type transport system substrate-binding protein